MTTNQSHDVQQDTNGGRHRHTSRFTNRLAALSRNLERKITDNLSFDRRIVFGPVPSRRLGLSLGINNLPPKFCSYNCRYCQAGHTTCTSICRDSWLSPYEIYCFVKEKIERLTRLGIFPDYISVVPNGEPTLDVNLSKEISILREFGIKLAVFTNSSLLWNDNVREDLLFADYVSLKIDTVDESTWVALNQPHRRLRFDRILRGIQEFANTFTGSLTTETMLVRTMNDSVEEIDHLAAFLSSIPRERSYFTIPTRPPAEEYTLPPDVHRLEELAKVIASTVQQSEMLSLPESGDFVSTGNVEEELQGILAVHPMSADAVTTFVRRNGGTMQAVEEMIRNGMIHNVPFQGKRFYVGSGART